MKLTKEYKSRVYGYILTKLRGYDYRRGWMKMNCPFCGGEDKLGANLSKDLFHCFKCGYVGSCLNTIKRIEESETFKEVFVVLRDYDSSNYHEKTVALIPKSPVILPESFKLLIIGRSRYGKMARSYMEGRGFNSLDLSRKGVGYCSKGKYRGYIILPYYDLGGRLIYFQTRLFFGSGPKFNNPTIEDFGIGKSSILYNEKALYEFTEVNIVESVINALTIGDNSVALSGKVASRIQLFKILKSPVEIVNIILDPDAWDEAINLALNLVKYKRVRLIKLEGDKDINDLGRDFILVKVGEQKIQTYNEILKLKINGKNIYN
jgi:DNA primase